MSIGSLDMMSPALYFSALSFPYAVGALVKLLFVAPYRRAALAKYFSPTWLIHSHVPGNLK